PCQRRFEGATLLPLLRASFAFASTLLVGLAIGNGRLAHAAPATDTPISNPFQSGASHDDDVDDVDETAPASPGREAEEDKGAEAASALHALTCLDGDSTGGRRKGVQRRDFLKRHRFELSGVGGFYASDALSSTYSYGGALAFYPSEDFGLELLVTR